MAEIKEFKALRFTHKAGCICELACPPYDIISPAEKEQFLKTNEKNIIRLELPEPTHEGYALAGATLDAWLEDGHLKCEDEDSIYIYEERFTVKGKEYSFKGFVSRVKLHPFSDGVVLPHEETLSKAKTDRLNLMRATGCNFSQIYSLYSDEKGESRAMIAELSKGEPTQSFTDKEGVTHSLWVVGKSEKTAALCHWFKDKKLYIADGHHRYETALNYKAEMEQKGFKNTAADYVMMFLVDMENPGLVVFPTHRIVRDLESFDGAALLKACEAEFEVVSCEEGDLQAGLDAAYEQGKVAFGYVSHGTAALLTLKDTSVMEKIMAGAGKAVRELDVSVLHSLILEQHLKIDKENMAKQINLTYTRSAEEALEAAKGAANCAFLLNPTRVEEIAAVAAAGEKMPQKSTYFYPKLITGMVMNKF